MEPWAALPELCLLLRHELEKRENELATIEEQFKVQEEEKRKLHLVFWEKKREVEKARRLVELAEAAHAVDQATGEIANQRGDA
jgi:hypothetical protein